MLNIVVPIYKPTATYLEQKSWERLLSICPGYPIILVGPEDLDVSWYLGVNNNSDVRWIGFDKKYFVDLISYSQLLITPGFYNKFTDQEFMLIYQLDAFIFRDDLKAWCEKGYDYIGAPFFFHYNSLGPKSVFSGVGNGGFSLRKVESLLRIITTSNKIYSRNQIEEQKEGINLKGRIYYELTWQLGRIGLLNNTRHGFNNFRGYEDYFWGYYAGPKLDWFKFPDYYNALNFSFEYNCEKLFRDNNFQLPTGCHAWWKIDREFWIPHFKEAGIDINTNLSQA